MIKANDLKRVQIEKYSASVKKSLEEIEKLLVNCTSYELSYYFPTNIKVVNDEIISNLKEAGYTVERNSYSDSRESCDLIKISW